MIGEEVIGKEVTFAVRQHTGNEPCRIKILRITANLGAKGITILV